jgi:anti-sigma B factor antagonist
MSQTSFSAEFVDGPPAAAILAFRCRLLVDYDEVQSTGGELFGWQEAHPDRQLALDFAGVQGISSAMLGKLITLHRRIERAGRKLVLCGLEPDVAEMFHSSRLDDYFKIVAGRSDALAWLGQ